MGFNVLNCDVACTSCIKSYSKKHELKKGDAFKVTCNGIPKEYLTQSMMESVDSQDVVTMLAALDPVTWAAEHLDWHCQDPDGEIWKRKTLEGSLGEVTPYKDEEYSELVKQGRSAYNRPYQATMLRCTAKRKVFRIGRQVGKSETICVAILHSVFTKKDFRVIVITPYQTQIEVIFNRLNKLIQASNHTSNSLKRYVKAPNYTIELHNGSTIRGFTAGTKSGGNADAVRGQKANMLVFDEADYLATEDMASALAVITNYPDATVWMSSTPTGKRERFYDSCRSPLYKEYYYPSMINPLWSLDLETFYRNEYTEIQYAHEILAEFGEQEQGVYQSAMIDEAMADYKYEEQSRDPNWMYSIGVDWNDEKVGTTIAVVGWHPINQIFKLFNRYTVSREGWTQTEAVMKLIELNRYWLPRTIYIDKGFGGVQYEIIRKYGYDALSNKSTGPGHPDARLHIITKQYDFGSKLTIKDPFTKQNIDKAAKPFLVEDSIRKFEQRAILFSKHDKQLESELRGYIIDHRTISGSPVYKQGNERVGDHNLDALNLALVAYTLELSHFGKVNYETHVAFTPGLGRPPMEPKGPEWMQQPNKPTAPVERVPSMTRTQFMEKGLSILDNPGGAVTKKPNRLWAWPGFESDAPRPNPRTPNHLTRRPPPPSRKKF